MGSKVAELATRRSHEVFSGYAEHPPELGEGIKYDLTDAKSIARVIRTSEPDIIIHTAALTDVDRCEIDKGMAFKANVLGTKVSSMIERRQVRVSRNIFQTRIRR